MPSSSTESLSAGVRHSLTLRYTLTLVAVAVSAIAGQFIVWRFAGESRVDAELLQTIEYLFLGLMLIVPVLAGLLIFRPVVADIAATIFNLETTTKRLHESEARYKSIVDHATDSPPRTESINTIE